MQMQRLPPKHLIPGVGTEDIRSSFGLSTSIRSLTPISVDWTTGLNGAPLAGKEKRDKHLRAGAFIPSFG